MTPYPPLSLKIFFHPSSFHRHKKNIVLSVSPLPLTAPDETDALNSVLSTQTNHLIVLFHLMLHYLGTTCKNRAFSAH